MANPEPTGTLLVIAMVVAVIAADIIVRLVLLPAQKDKFIHELLDHLAEVEAETQAADSWGPTVSQAGDIQECLLRHFEKSGTSRQILNVLFDKEGLTQRELVNVLNRALAESGKAPLPVAVARRVAMILLHAGLLDVKDGSLKITSLGRNLNLLLQTRKQAVTA